MSRQSRSLSGQPFSIDNDILLRTVTAARQWCGSVWVPAKLAARLNLPLRPDTAPPVLLSSSNGSGFFYHAEQFAAPLSALQEAWDNFSKGEGALADPHHTESPSNSVAPSAVSPLSTNGERFDRETETRMLRCANGLRNASTYWATAAEATYLYNRPFHEAYLADTTHAVYANASPLCRPVAFYNVEGTIDPAHFTKETCCRYDPVNYEGRFYKPCVAVTMKAFALRHHCLHERQWITTRRASALGLSAPRVFTPVSFFNMSVHLINVAVLKRSALIRGRAVSSSVSPAGVGTEAESESELERTLLMSSNCCVESTPKKQVLATPTQLF
ncbi:hypothetical protein ABB37_06603 [Leptomonas pyrrhocoris]|uniref:Trypanosoma Tc-38 (p38) protein domain-containing protein n=1 Tax=Leptomonas pyrrhocoris TaxID=157538 RepID=A0A0M9FX61_LEPPY|nr:hypothetical protein ABB37_06603 [Leptomonas pyrrhocoris]KPA77767.1 hypothetical protein ABB37_06603 [Leptomonas pyrrhocoris]|eukprot:XP_015656206.1 hypothetical protein ABB37_06603 [Leptomonas pyrrhocoris]